MMENTKYRVETMKYMGPTQQNELIRHMGESLEDAIKVRLHERNYFFIMADETSDVSNKEQNVPCNTVSVPGK